jgi:hypothetical protein
MEDLFYINEQGIKILFHLNNNNIEGNIKLNKKMIQKISAIHIHKNINGKPCPILYWLATSKIWQNGVLQNTPNTNNPCYSNYFCNLTAPKDTFYIDNILGNTNYFSLYFNGNQCNKKECLENFKNNFIVIHGTNFQQIYNGCVTSGKPGLDIISINKLTNISKSSELIRKSVLKLFNLSLESNQNKIHFNNNVIKSNYNRNNKMKLLHSSRENINKKTNKYPKKFKFNDLNH